MEHPTPTLPHSEVQTPLHGAKQPTRREATWWLEQPCGPEGLLDHPRARCPESPPPPSYTRGARNPKSRATRTSYARYYRAA